MTTSLTLFPLTLFNTFACEEATLPPLSFNHSQPLDRPSRPLLDRL
jgi:hypothetical protein